MLDEWNINLLFRADAVLLHGHLSHMQPIFCLCDPRCLDMVSLPEIKAAFDNGCSGGGTAPT